MIQPPLPIPQIMLEIKNDRPHLTPSDLEYIKSRFEWDRYQNNLYGAYKRTKVNQSEEKQAA